LKKDGTQDVLLQLFFGFSPGVKEMQGGILMRTGKRWRKGQVSIELMVIIGFVVLLLMPVLFSLYYRTNQANEQLSLAQADLVATRLASTIDVVGTTLGSSIITEAIIPNGVKSIKIEKNEVNIKIGTYVGDTEVVKHTRFEADASCSDISKMKSAGTYMVEVRSSDNGICVKLV